MPSIAYHRVHNRIQAILLHIDHYSCKSQARLAQEVGTTQATISRLITGQDNPSYALAMGVIKTLEKYLGKQIDPREVLSMDGSFPTASVCELCGCPGCLPPQVYDKEDRIKPEYRLIRPGQWVLVTDPAFPRDVRVEALTSTIAQPNTAPIIADTS